MSSLSHSVFIYNLVVLAIIASGYFHLWAGRKYHAIIFSAIGAVAAFVFYIHRVNVIELHTLWWPFLLINAFFVVISLVASLCVHFVRLIKNHRR